MNQQKDNNTAAGAVFLPQFQAIDQIKYAWNEKVLLDEILVYINSTYKEHYGGGIQTTEFIGDQCDSPDFFRGNILKYASRYGKKDGYNRKDILKTIHYALMLLSWHDKTGK